MDLVLDRAKKAAAAVLVPWYLALSCIGVLKQVDRFEWCGCMVRATGGGKSYRFAAGEEEAAAAELVECSRSCTAVAVADCVALGCCPCAVAAALGWLALVKAPWAASRSCMRMLRRSLRRRIVGDDDRNNEAGKKKKASPREAVARRSDWEEAVELVEGMGSRFEPDRVWLELYQIGQWGFGRLSFSELQGATSN